VSKFKLTMLQDVPTIQRQRIVIYTTREEGKAFVHANCMFVHDAQRRNAAIATWVKELESYKG
jgi:hypothetical protein